MAAQVDSNLRALYDQLSDQFILGPYDEFVKRMQDPENRQALYKQASEVFDLGPYEEFERRILPDITGEPAPQRGAPLYDPTQVVNQLQFTTAPAESTTPLPETPEERRAMIASLQAKRERQQRLQELADQYPELQQKGLLDIFGEQFLQGMTAGLFRPGFDFSKGLTPEQEQWLQVTNPAIYSLYKTNPQFVLQELQSRSQQEQATQEFEHLKQPGVSMAAEFTGMMAPFAAMNRALSFASLGDSFPTLQRLGRLAENALKSGAPVREWGIEYIASKSPTLIENVAKGAAMGAGWAQLTREPGESDEAFARRRLQEMGLFAALDAGLGIFGEMIVPLLRAGTSKQAMKIIDQLPAEQQSAGIWWLRNYGKILDDPEYKKMVTALAQELNKVPKGELEAWTQTRTPEMFPARRVPEEARFESAGPVVVDRQGPYPPTMPPPGSAAPRPPVAGELPGPAIPGEPPKRIKVKVALKDDPTQVVQAGLNEYDLPILNTTEEALAWGFRIKGKPKQIQKVVEAIQDLQREAQLLAKEGRAQEAMQLSFEAQMMRESLATATGKYWHYNARGELLQSDIPEFLKKDIEEARKLARDKYKQAVKPEKRAEAPKIAQEGRSGAEATDTIAKAENVQNRPGEVENPPQITKGITQKAEGEPREAPSVQKVAKEQVEQKADKEIGDIKITNDILDSNRGEKHGIVRAFDKDGNQIGVLEYSNYDGETAIKWIEVKPEYRRKGIGTKLRNKLKEDFPEDEIVTLGDYVTNEGEAFESSFKKSNKGGKENQEILKDYPDKEPWQMTRDEFEIIPTFGDYYLTPDGKFVTIRGSGHLGSKRVKAFDVKGNFVGYYNRDELTFYRPRKYETSATKAADKWLEEVSSKVRKLKKENEDLLFKADLTDRYRKEVAKGTIPKEEYDKKVSEGFLLNDEQYKKAQEIRDEIERVRNTKLEIPENKEHKRIVEQALKEGKPVPEKVLKDYPDLAKKYGNRPKATETTPSKRLTVVDVPVKDIQRDVDAFQNRASEYSEESVQRIVDAAKKGEFRFEEFDPILLWEDPQTKKLFVLSGHSRAEAFNRLAKEGFTDFEQIPAKIIRDVPKDEAMQIARRSNVLATRETPVERAMYYRKLREEGKSKAEIEAEAKRFEGRNAQTVLAYSYLNPKGKVIDALKRAGEDPDTMKFARWVGDARRLWPELSDIHEKELWDYLSEGQKRFNSWAEFREFLQRVMQEKQMTGLKPDELLNLKRLRPLTRQELEFEQKIADIEQELRRAKQALDRKRREYVQRGASAEEIERALKRQQDEVIALEQELVRLKEQYSKRAGEIREKQLNLFEVLENEEEALRKAGISEETIQLAREGNPDALKRGIREADQAAKEAQKAAKDNITELRPFTPEEVRRYNRYSHYETNINDEFEALAKGTRREVMDELQKAGITDVPEAVQKRLDDYLQKAQDVYRAAMRSNEIAPSPSVVGRAKYPAHRVKKAESLYQKAIAAADEAREQLFKAVRQATREQRFAEENAALAKVSDQAAFEQSLKPGNTVQVRWTNSGRQFSARAKVVKVNPRSIRVRLTESVKTDIGTYPEGHELVVPRFGSKKYSANNRVVPGSGRKSGELYMAIVGGPDDFRPRDAARAFIGQNRDRITPEEAARLLNAAKRLPEGKEGFEKFKAMLERDFGDKYAIKEQKTTAEKFEEVVKKADDYDQYVKLQRKVRGMARKANMDDLELHEVLEETTGKRSFKGLSVDELNKVVDAIEERMRPIRDKYAEQKQQFIRNIDDPEVRRDIEAIEKRNRELRQQWMEKRKENPEWPIFAKAGDKGGGLLSRIGSLFLDSRYAWENAEINTGLPFRRLGLNMIKAAREIRATADKKLESIFEGLNVKPKDVVGFKDAEDQIRLWIVSGGETPIDPKLLPVAERIKQLLEAEQETIRRIRFERWMRGEAEKPPNAPLEVLEEGRRILLEEGEDAFERWLKEQTWGTRKDYLPSLHQLNLELDEFGQNLLERSKGQFETRTGEYYNPRPLFRELRRYFMNIEAYKKLRPLKKELQKMLQEAGVDKSSTEFKEIQNWWRRLNGFSFTNTVADKIINRVRSWFWRGLLNNNAFIYARNLFQNVALLYQKLGLRAMVKHGWKLFLPNVKLTGDEAAAKAMREYFDTYLSELSGLERDFFFVENVVTKYKLTREAKRMLEWLPSKYGVTDLFNRLKAFRIVYDNAKDLLSKYRNGKIGVRRLMRNTGGYNLTNMEQEELLSYLAKGNDEAFLRRLSEMITNNTHFKYTRFEKSLAEQSNVGQHLFDTFTWWKGNIQNLWKGGVERIAEGARKGNWSEAYAGLRTLAGYFIAATAANYAMEKLLGKGKASYGLLSFRYTPGGVALNTIIRAGAAASDFIATMAEKDVVLKKYAKARLTMNANQLLRLLPFVDFYLNMYEAVNDVKGVNVMKELRRLILRDAGVRYKRAKRSSVEAWQHFLFGTNEQPAAERQRPKRRPKRRARLKRILVN